MSAHDFSLEVEGIEGACPAGERYATRQMAQQSVPVMSCEGPCIRGEIARLAANLVAQEVPGLARACHAETFFVPGSAMREWVSSAPRTVMIDGCFLQCHGRVLRKLVGGEKVVHFDAHGYHRKFSSAFLVDEVPEEERKATARKVADSIIADYRARY